MIPIEKIENYKNLKCDDVQVTVTYYAKVTATVNMPKEMGVKEIIKELKNNHYGYNQEDVETIKFVNMSDIIIDGYDIDEKFIVETLKNK